MYATSKISKQLDDLALKDGNAVSRALRATPSLGQLLSYYSLARHFARMFIFRRTYRLGHAFYAILDLVCKGRPKVTFLPPT